MHIHVLGTGAIGCYISAFLKLHNNKVTLLLRSQWHVDELKKKQNTILYHKNDETVSVPGFDAINVLDKENNSNEPIEALVVATKALYTAEALKPILHRLTQDSIILLVQNGIGIADELVEKLWSKVAPCPRILITANRHVIDRISPFEVIHQSGYAEKHALFMGECLTNNRNYKKPSEFINAMTSATEIKAILLPLSEVRVQMTRKLFINLTINPISTVLDFKLKGLTYNQNPACIKLMKAVCVEAYQVLKDDLPGESPETLLQNTLNVIKVSGDHICSTLHDARVSQLTEIDYLNGYVCKRGMALGIPTPVNQTLVDLVHSREYTYGMLE